MNLLGTADRLLIGGGMSYTFLNARGYEVGHSLLEADQVPQVTEVMAEAERRGVEIVLPVDLVAAADFAADAEHERGPGGGLPGRPGGRRHRPARPGSCSRPSWPTPRRCSGTARVGVFEFPAFAGRHQGCRRGDRPGAGPDGGRWRGLGRGRAQLGFSATAFTHISTGGGASLEYLEGKQLPGLAALEDA